MGSSIVKELPELVENNVITPEMAKAIEHYYADKKGGGNQLLIFGGLGSVLTGLGIILIFAHNWDDFSRGTKTFLALLPLVLSQVATGYSLIKDKPRLWKEVSGLLLFFSVGAAIALISQIYNMPGEESSYILMWVVLCFPLMYILRSDALAFMHLAFSTFYAVVTGYFNPHAPWLYLVLLAILIPYYVNQLKQGAESYIASIFNSLIPLSLIIALGAFISGADEFGFVIYITFLCLLYNIGLLPYFSKYTYGWNGYLNVGRVGIAVLLLSTSFRFFWRATVTQPAPELYFILLCIAFFGGALYFGFKAAKGRFRPDIYQCMIIIFPVIYIIGTRHDYVAAVLNNLLVLVLGVLAIRDGAARVDFSMLNFGLLIISALIISRFFDTNISFAIRGILFIAVGAGFFAGNYLVSKKRKQFTKNQQP